MNEFCTKKGIRREFNNARTPQQNGVAERRNRTLIKAVRTMLADAKLHVTFWAEVVNTACYVQNRVLVNKSQNKTPYELFNSRIPAIGFLRPFGCHVMILNTLDHLGKFDSKWDEGYFVRYSLSSKAFRVFNKRTKKVEENLHVNFLENKLIEKGAGPNWLFDIDNVTNYMNYVPVVVAGTSSTNISGIKDVASQALKTDVSSLRYINLPNWFHEAHTETRNSDAPDGCNADDPKNSRISNPIATSKISLLKVQVIQDSFQKGILVKKRPSLDNALTLTNRLEDTFGMEADLSNMETSIPASPTPTFRIHKDHPKSQIIGPVDNPIQTRHKSKEMKEQSFIAIIHQKTNHDLLQFCLLSCFLSQEEPKKIFDALKDPSWVEAMQEELLQFKIQNEEGINYEEVFAPVARIEAIRLFLSYASFMGFIVYQMDVKSAFLYGTIDEEVYVMQPLRFQDLDFPNRVYKVEKAMYGLHQAPRAWYVYVDDIIFGSSNPQLCREFKALMHDKFQMSAMGELTFFLGLQVLQKKDGIFLSQDKYVGDILKKFGYLYVRQYTRRAKRIAQSKALSSVANELASLSRDDRQGEAFPTVSSLDARQDRENINKTYALPYESLPRVTYLDADEGNQDLEISRLKVRVKSLEDKERRSAEPTQEDASITEGIIETGEELGMKKSTELGSNDTEEMVNVLSSMKAANILTSGVVAASVFPAADVSAAGVPSVSGSFPTVSVIFTTASVVTPYLRWPRGITIRGAQHMRSPIIGAKDKGKQKVVESEVPKKRKLQEQVDAQVAKEMEEEFARENQRVSERLVRDSEIARLHAKEELKMMIEGLERRNEVIAKHLQEYEQAAADLSSKPLSNKEQREFYMSVLRSHARWKTKHFRGMTLEQLKEKFIHVWKQFEDFVPMNAKEKSERIKKQGLKIDQGSSKRMKTSKSVSEDVSEEELKGMMQLVPLEEVYVKALQVKHLIIDWEIHSEGKREYWMIIRLGGHTAVYHIKQVIKDKEKELWVELKRLFEPDFEDQLWTHNQAFMHDLLDWKLYDTCGVHHVFTKDQEIFMLVEKDYSLKRGLATVMICNKLQVEQYSQIANDLILKIHNIANSPR
nr:hypothetical protein [Tanacetum cinerariifolium]